MDHDMHIHVLVHTIYTLVHSIYMYMNMYV